MAAPTLLQANSVDPDELGRFLERFYGPAKSAFLAEHGAWWHRGSENRWVVQLDDQIAGYCAVIPTQCWLGERAEPALWWVDLIVAPEFRGQGLQRLLDDHLRNLPPLKLGFPNPISAPILQKHGWALREDLEVMLMPLRPLGVTQVRRATGFRGLVLRAGALAATPLVAGWCRRFRYFEPRLTRLVEEPTPQLLADVFARYRRQVGATTYRDAAFFQWRYLDAPYPVRCFVSGAPEAPTHYLLARHVVQEDVATTRILDLFGDFDDTRALRDLIFTAIRDAVEVGTAQITVLAPSPTIKQVLRAAGFRFAIRSRFCWYSASDAMMKALDGPVYWTLGDSDNDEISAWGTVPVPISALRRDG